MLNADSSCVLAVRQEGSPAEGPHVVRVPPRGRAFWHWTHAAAPTRLLVKFEPAAGAAAEAGATGWALGGVSIGGVGGHAVWLPPARRPAGLGPDDALEAELFTVGPPTPSLASALFAMSSYHS